MQFTATPRGARLARRLVSHRLDQWGFPYDCDTNTNMTLIAAELCANAVRHGLVPGQDFRLRLTATTALIRIEVTDTRPENLAPAYPDETSESGRGLLLVAHLATRWSVVLRTDDGPGKTVIAELSLIAPPLAVREGRTQKSG